MFEFEKLCREVEKMDPLTYGVIVGKKSRDVIDGLAGITENGIAGIEIYMCLVLGAVVSDGKISEEEFMLIKPMLDTAVGYDITIEDANAILRYFKEETKEYKQFTDAVTDLFGEISDELKTDIVTVCLLVCGIDGKISLKERKWLKQLIK